MRKKYIVQISLCVYSFLVLNINFAFGNENDTSSTAVKLVSEGNKLLGKGYFSEAKDVWLKVLEQDAENANANFKVGLCYFNSIDEQTKALPYFIKAAQNVSEKYDFFNSGEKAAPYDVFYFLGQTYLTSNQPDSALMMFFLYDDKFAGKAPIPVYKQIRNCIYAKNAIKSPRDVTLKNPGKNVNSEFTETNPVLTIDNSVIFFASRKEHKDGTKHLSNISGKYDEDIYYSYKSPSGNWEEAVAFKWNSDEDEAPLCLSADGLTLYLRKEVNGQTDIFQSNYTDKVWSQPEPLSDINTPFNETGVSISADGKNLYFCSDREGGIGKYDIYQCVKSGKHWKKIKNLGLSVNTPFSEISPFINPNGKTLFFSSNGYNDAIGGFDIFYTEMRDDGTWTQPQNMGYPVNTPGNDINFYIIGGGTRYYSTVREENNSYDIFKIEGGGFPIENIEAGDQVVTLTKEMSVTDVLEVEKTVEKEVEVVETVETTVEVIKEVETVDVEKEKMKMDSMMSVARAEAQAEKVKLELEKAQAEIEKVKIEASIKLAETEKVKAEAVIKKAEADKALAEAAKAKSEADKVAAEAVIAAAQKAKEDAVIEKAKADTKKYEAAIAESNATKAKADADKIKSKEHIAIMEVDKVKFAAEKAKAEEAALQLKTKLAEAEKPKYEAMKIQAEADILKAKETIAATKKAKHEAMKAKYESYLQKAHANLETAKVNAESKKAEAEKVKAQKEIAMAEKAKADAAKASAIAETTKANAEIKKADTDKIKAQADIANASKAKADADKTIAIAEKRKADAEIKKAQAEIAAAEKSKADAAKTQALAEKAKYDAESKKAQAEIIKAQKEKKQR